MSLYPGCHNRVGANKMIELCHKDEFPEAALVPVDRPAIPRYLPQHPEAIVEADKGRGRDDRSRKTP